MCDYSLEHLASRNARVADRLVSSNFLNTLTRGFAAKDDPNTAVCLLPAPLSLRRLVRQEVRAYDAGPVQADKPDRAACTP